MALIETPFGVYPLEWLEFIVGTVLVTVLATWFLLKRRGTPENEPVTEAWELEASGLIWPVPVLRETPTDIEYKIQYSKSMEPVSRIVKASRPLTPVGTSQRVYLIARGSTTALDPRDLVENGQDQDDPEPLIQESASWYRRAREMMESTGLKLKENWFTLLMIGIAMFGVGVIVEAKFLLVPAAP